MSQTRLRSALIAGMVAAALAQHGPAARAQDATGAYVTGSLGFARYRSDHQQGCVENSLGTYPGTAFGEFACTDGIGQHDSFAARAGAGWRFNSHVAVELAYVSLGRTTIDRQVGNDGRLPDGTFTMPSSAFTHGHYRIQGVDTDLSAAIPLRAGFSVTGRLGAIAYFETYDEISDRGTHGSRFDWSSSANGVSPMLGAGLAYDFSPNARLRLDWMRVWRVGKVFTGFSGLGGTPGGGRFDLDVLFLTGEYAINGW
jgi:hypothetical protein